MISFYKLYRNKLLLDPYSLKPFSYQGKAIEWLNKNGLNKKKMKGLKQKRYQVTEEDIEKLNSEAFKEYVKNGEKAYKEFLKKKYEYETRK